MKFPSIRIEGSILAGDILEKIEQGDVAGQKPSDFGLAPDAKVKDEIVRAWADAQDLWRIFRRKLEATKEGSSATTETRNFWVVPLLGLLGYQVELARKGEEVLGKNYFLSHRVPVRDQFVVHIMGYRDSLDKKREDSGPRMSPHALVQEYLNLTEHLYAIVTNGQQLRLLRDSSRLIKLSYLEFDLERMMEEEIFPDFALLYRLVHVSRMPLKQDAGAESIIERYHQDSLESGSRIRDGLSAAVEKSIVALANGFLSHPDNQALRDAVKAGTVQGTDLYQWLLRLIYRVLFLMVIEERDLVYPKKANRKQRDIYYRYYSIQRLRKLGEKRYFADKHFEDAWLGLNATFRLFEAGSPGHKLGVAPLAGDLFSERAIGLLNNAQLDNEVLLTSFRNLSIFQHPDSKQWIRVNYGALNVEEFGSVYEGLLKRQPVLLPNGERPTFELHESTDDTQSHYTPDELAHPLIHHSLDYVIEEKLKEKDKEKALLSIRVLDLACGSGHILLNAARRIATELAIVRTGEDQPSPSAFREAVRDVIRHCIYGVDVNPLAVELCKVALWLEANVPGESLNFLDHHIKCGNAIVGLAHEHELQRGIPDEAFKTLPGDDKALASAFRKSNKQQREEAAKAAKQIKLDLIQTVRQELRPASQNYAELGDLPDHTPEDYAKKQARFDEITQRKDLWRLRTLANLQVAQFFTPKTPKNRPFICTEEEYRDYLTGKRHPQSQAVARANALGVQKHWFHWFIEFPDLLGRGGFDVVIGNPPYLGGQALSGTFGHEFCEWLKAEFAPAGLSDLAVFFLRRDYELVRHGGFVALITTNSIKDGDVRADGLEQVMKHGGDLTFAVSGTIWPGVANLYVSLFSLYRGLWGNKTRVLDGRKVPFISAFFEGYAEAGQPLELAQNADRVFQGSIFSGDGFLLEKGEASAMFQRNSALREVVLPVINGQELNNHPDQAPGRYIIQFFDWPIEKAQGYGEAFERLRALVKPWRDQNSRLASIPWWQFERPRLEVYRGLAENTRCFLAAATTKHLNFSASAVDRVFLNTTYIFTSDRWHDYAVVQSTIHEVWARKYSGALKRDLRYSPTDCFSTFPFPQSVRTKETLSTQPEEEKSLLATRKSLDQTGEHYHEHRRQLMLKLQLGLTKTYNLFHDPKLSVELVSKESKQPLAVAESALADVLQLRTLHELMNQAVLAAYGWDKPSDAGPALTLGHAFYEVDYLPENDRTRYTIHPDARKELLKRLLLLNHKLYAEEEATGMHKKKQGKKTTSEGDEVQAQQQLI
jgi:methylase of polypeptide subunit release factors